MKTIVIQGLGEMGGSLAAALYHQHHIIGVDQNTDIINEACAKQIIHEGTTNLSAVAGKADVIILATPVSVILSTIKTLGQLVLKDDVIITDAGSTKQSIFEQAKITFDQQYITFIGGHAMAGTQNSGLDAVNPTLYQGVPYFLIPIDEQSKQNIPELKQILQSIGANFTEIGTQQHDDLMAMISDVPHIAAFALVNAAVKQLGDAQVFGQYVAGGFKDTTRIAGSNAKVWTDILLSNQDSIVDSLHVYTEALKEIEIALTNGNRLELEALLSRAQDSRQHLGEKA